MRRGETVPNAVFRAQIWREWLAFGIVAILLAALAVAVSVFYGRNSALVALQAQGRIDANLKVALLQAVLERPRALPLLLARDRDVEEGLAANSNSASDALSAKLENLVSETNAAVIYVVNSAGIAIAASNWREDTSFVGNDYRFRTYFSQGLEQGKAEHFALGTVSKRAGLYISHRVGPAAAPLGIVVVKMEFDQLEKTWGDAQRPSYVVDSNNVILISSIPSWRFMTTERLPAGSLAAIRDSLQFGDAPLLPINMTDMRSLSGDATLVRALLPGDTMGDYLRITVPVASTRWKLQYLLPVEASIAAAVRETILFASLVLALVLAMAALWLWRRQRARAMIVAERLAREELEVRVAARTLDLSMARDRLEAEISNHRATETRLQAVQQDLVQANRLAILGQVAAGVAHEINQPVATIRAYADNSKVFLERRQTAPVMENLGLIAGLTERIGAITADLRSLARRGRTAPEPVDLKEAVDGALVLLRSRFTGRLDLIRIDGNVDGLKVIGNRLRLEQVFINLFQNALEALDGQEGGQVLVSAAVIEDRVAISIADNGPGMESFVREALFEPFNSSKETGLGLGLVISKEIITDYGGSIDVVTDHTGTAFTIELQKAYEP